MTPRLALVHALTLWALAGLEGEDARERGGNGAIRVHRLKHPREPKARAADPQALVGHWLASTRRGPEHPFVAEARELAILAWKSASPRSICGSTRAVW